MKGFGTRLALVALSAWLCGCTAAPAQERAQDIVIVDQLQWLKDGEQWAFKLDPGMYKVELTASQDGATVEWIGSACPGSTQLTKNYATICELQATGQLLVKNPTVFGIGPAVSVTLKITKLAR